MLQRSTETPKLKSENQIEKKEKENEKRKLFSYTFLFGVLCYTF